MAIVLEDGTLTFSPEEWEHERHFMAVAAFDDLRCAITGINQDGMSFIPSAAYITDAFELLASGLDRPVADFADRQAEFTRTLGNDARSRAVLMRAALDNLSRMIGFTPQPPVFLGTYALTEES